MRPLETALVIEPGKTVKLAPGSYHVMLMDLKSPLKQGEKLQIRFEFERAGKVTVSFDVEGVGAQEPVGASGGKTGVKKMPDHSRMKMSQLRPINDIVGCLVICSRAFSIRTAAQSWRDAPLKSFRFATCSSDHFWSAAGSADPSIVVMSPLREISIVRGMSSCHAELISYRSRSAKPSSLNIQFSTDDRAASCNIDSAAASEFGTRSALTVTTSMPGCCFMNSPSSANSTLHGPNVTPQKCTDPALVWASPATSGLLSPSRQRRQNPVVAVHSITRAAAGLENL